MDFNPADAAGPSSSTPLPEGVYTLVVREAEERQSQRGNDMIALVLEYEQDGTRGSINEYLVSTPQAVFKIEQFCRAAGLVDQFQSGTLLPGDCLGKEVRAQVVIEAGTDSWPDRNKVGEFLPPQQGISTMPEEGIAVIDISPVTTVVDEKDIPF